LRRNVGARRLKLKTLTHKKEVFMERKEMTRRDVLKIGAAAGVTAAAGSLVGAASSFAQGAKQPKFKVRTQCHGRWGRRLYKLHFEGYCNASVASMERC
jgi:hypothetical protein